MHLDAFDLKDFYARPLGLMVRRLLRRRIRARWSNLRGLRVFGLGFATPYLAEYRSEAQTLGALMPAAFGALPWPASGESLTALVEETELPLDDETADRILLVHMLEWSERSRTLLREIWRVLGPGGRLLIVVPNRRGLWARVDTTPFGYGRPFSRSQLTKFLKECMFQPESWEYALFMPPFAWRVLVRWPGFWERLGLVLWPTFSGTILVEATKQVYAASPARETERKMRRRIVPAPAGISSRVSARAKILPVRQRDSAPTAALRQAWYRGR